MTMALRRSGGRRGPEGTAALALHGTAGAASPSPLDKSAMPVAPAGRQFTPALMALGIELVLRAGDRYGGGAM